MWNLIIAGGACMDFFEKMQGGLSDGLAVSRDLFRKAKDKAKDLSEIGVLKYEIKQLENMSEKLASRLGVTVYQVLCEGGQGTVSKRTPGVREVIDEIDEIRSKLEQKQRTLSDMQANKNDGAS